MESRRDDRDRIETPWASRVFASGQRGERFPSSYWRQTAQERELGRASASLFRRIGLGEGLPEYPDDRELGAAFLKSESREKFRDEVLGRYGGDAGMERMYLVHPMKEKPDEPAAADNDWIRLDDDFRMTDKEFLDLRDAARGVSPDDRASLAEHCAWHWPVASEADLPASGFKVAQLTDAECVRFLVACGGKVVALTEGGLAEKAGLKLGDVLWTVDVDDRQTSDGSYYRKVVRNPAHVEMFLSDKPPEGSRGFNVRVIRDGELVSVVLVP